VSDNDEEFRMQCLRRHYENMDIMRAKKLKAELEPKNKPTTKSKIFVKRINYAKGYDFL